MALFCAGCMDAFHVLAADRLLHSVADSVNLIPFTWALCRSFNAVIMLGGVLIVCSRSKKGRGTPVSFVGLACVVLGGTAFAIIHYCATRNSLPTTMFPGSLVTRPYDVAPLVLFLVAGVVVYPRLYRRSPSFFTHALCLSAIPDVATQLHMAFGSSSLFDNGFNVAHFLKIVAYVVPLFGLCIDYFVTHRNADSSRARMRAVISTAADGIITIDQKGTIESFNAAATQMFGYSEREAIGMNIKSMMPSPHREHHDEYIESFLHTGTSRIIGRVRETEGLRRDGALFPIDLNVSVVESRRRRSFTGLVRDVSRRKESENELSKLSAAVEQNPSIVVITDVHGTIEYVNSSFVAVTGYTKEEALGRNPRILKSSQTSEGIYRSLWETISKGEVWRGEFLNRKKNGELYWESGSISPVRNAKGQVTHYLAVKQDITQRKKADQQLREQNISLANKNRELDEFTYVASHDLQEPLRKLVSFSTLLKTDIGGDLPEKAATDIKFITDSAKRMEALVQDLLQLSRSGRSDMKRESIPLNECADHALESLSTAIEEAEAVIERDDLPDVVADRTLMTQLFQNLIGNALKYRSPDRTPVIRITVESSETGWLFGVRDNGIGMESQYVEQIFAPFKRLHGRGEYKGTGIGLAICRKVVDRHGGRIWAESVFGEGSHFKFTLNRGKEKLQWTNELVAEPLSC